MRVIDLEVFKDKHRGQTCIICGNGPTLKDMPRELLTGYPSFGTNRVYLLPGFTPTYYVAVNPLIIQQFSDDINRMVCTKFIDSQHKLLIKDCYPLRSTPEKIFSVDPRQGIYEGYTVTYTCLQLAYFMGFTTAVLVGVRHEYIQEGRPNSIQEATGPDLNHFAADYFTDGHVWHLADIERSTEAYRLAQGAYARAGRRIFNLTPGTKLDVFRKSDIKLWMPSPV